MRVGPAASGYGYRQRLEAAMRRCTLTVLVLVFVVPFATAALGGCSSSGSSGGSPNGGGMMGGGNSTSNSYTSAGESIFLSGVGTDGQRIPHSATRVSQGSLMMGGGGCASCHGVNGRGGTLRMMTGAAIKAPDVTYDALIKAGFTDATIRTAIRDGLDETGQPLDAAMPRWQMSDPELDATIAYLRVLSGQ
jgi:cytochrome c oxidase subunit II